MLNPIPLPKSIEKILGQGIRELQPARVVIFGSRARGDNRATSDFDLAFYGVKNLGAWSTFAAEMIYDAPTLYGLDLVRFESAPPELQQSIQQDGVMIYEDASRKAESCG